MNTYTLSPFRGPEFRAEYANISELRSIICKTVNMMALTATVTSKTRELIMGSLCMEEDTTFVLSKVPNKLNIRYSVKEKPSDIDLMVKPIVSNIMQYRDRSQKTIVFCRTYKEYTEVASSLVFHLCENDVFYVERNGSKIPVCEMYSASTDETVKDKILSSFVDPDGVY